VSLSPTNSTWRTNYEEYKRLVLEGYNEVINDAETMLVLQEKYPQDDIQKSLHSNMILYWMKEDGGWNNKKSKRGQRRIDMARTLINSLEYERNRIMKSSFPSKPIQKKVETWRQEQQQSQEQLVISEMATEIGRLIWKLPNRVEFMRQHTNDFNAAISAGAEKEYLEQTMNLLKVNHPEIFKETNTVEFKPKVCVVDGERNRQIAAQILGKA
jgi:hypothetical protein